MTIRLYLDHHVPDAIDRGLQQRGLDVLRAYNDGFAGRSDEELLIRATELRRAILTQDRDFLELAAAWQQAGRDFAGIIYAHQCELPLGRNSRVGIRLPCRRGG